MKKTFICLILLTLYTTKALAQGAPEIATDRPDVAESSLTVGAGAMQVEAGIDVDRTSDLTALRLPTKLRYGVTELAEIHFESDLWALDHTTKIRNSPVPIDLGGKLHLVDVDGAIPSVGLLVALTLPAGSDTDLWSLSPTLAMDWDLTDGIGLGLNLGITSPLVDRDLVDDSLRAALAVGLDLPMENLGAYLEIFGEQALGANGPSLWTDGGLTYGWSKDVQLDGYLRAPLVDATGLGLGLGISARFP